MALQIQKVDFSESNYYPHDVAKRAICIHHTVSGPGIHGDLATWQKSGRVATHYIIERDGTIHQLFDDLHWGHHLGIKSSVFRNNMIKYRFDAPPGREWYDYKSKQTPSNNHWLDAQTIGIELDSWGPLEKQADGTYDHVYERQVQEGCEVVMYRGGFRGHTYYEKYYNAQLDALRDLLIHLTTKHRIPNKYHEEMWDVNSHALDGGAGIWSHTSYREDKSDAHPQEELKNMLSSLILSGVT